MITPHFRTAVLVRYHVWGLTYMAETSTRPGYHVSTWGGGFVKPGSVATYATAEEAMAEAERRAGEALRAGPDDQVLGPGRE